MLKTPMANDSAPRQAEPNQARTAGIGSIASSLPHPADLLWAQSTLIFVIAAGELLAVILSTLGAKEGWLVRFGLYSFAIQWNVMFTLGLLYLARGWLRKQGIVTVVLITIGMILVVTLASSAISHQLFSPVMPDPGSGWLSSGIKLAISLVSMTLLALLVLRGQWLTHQQTLRAQQAELDALRARVNPHFLFNTLNTATALLHGQPQLAERVLLDLSDLFRATLSGSGESSLQEEIQLTQKYLEIESLRLGERLQVDWQLPIPVPLVQVPTLVLQTLVENAIRHGVEGMMTSARLAIEISRQSDNMIVMRVENPLPDSQLTWREGHRVGLAASRARIEAMTAGLGGLRTHVERGRFVAEVSLPSTGQG